MKDSTLLILFISWLLIGFMCNIIMSIKYKEDFIEDYRIVINTTFTCLFPLSILGIFSLFILIDYVFNKRHGRL